MIESDEQNKMIISEMMNKIYQNEEIPKSWLEGEIIRFYKEKGIKGKCCNERGITLGSNMGKLFERIINNKITSQIDISEAQAGGKQGQSTVDHLIIINSIIKKNKVKKGKKNLYIAFLDVTKAYDKAWLNAILYTMNKSGVDNKNWKIIKNLNTNLTAKIRTKHGLTAPIQIRDSIRQGGVLSVIEYANMIDDIAKNIKVEGKGTMKIGNTETTGCLLWMDDVALIHEDKNELQTLLDITDETAKRYHIKFGKEKSQIIKIGPDVETKFEIGETEMDETNKYKYLGMIINNKGTMEDHIKNVKAKTEAALQTIFNIAGYGDFHKIKMEIIWKLVNACIIPTLTYAAEAWIATKQEIKQIQKILDNTIKRILRAPTTTPSESIMMETGVWDIQSYVDQKQMIYFHKISNREENTTVKQIIMDPENEWNKNLKKTMKKYNIEEGELNNMTKTQAKRHINTKIEQNITQNLIQTSEHKSKVKDQITHKDLNQLMRKPKYISNLTRKECSSIFATRARMIKVKGNFKNAYTDLTCRWCNNKEETQIHILQECENLKTYTKEIDYKKIMGNQTEDLKEEAQQLEKLINLLNEKNQITYPISERPLSVRPG
jgi:hypothetical protein